MITPVNDDVALSSVAAILRRQLATAIKFMIRAVDAVVVRVFRFLVAITLIASLLVYVLLCLAAVLRLPLFIRSLLRGLCAERGLMVAVDLRCVVWIGTLIGLLINALLPVLSIHWPILGVASVLTVGLCRDCGQ